MEGRGKARDLLPSELRTNANREEGERTRESRPRKDGLRLSPVPVPPAAVAPVLVPLPAPPPALVTDPPLHVGLRLHRSTQAVQLGTPRRRLGLLLLPAPPRILLHTAVQRRVGHVINTRGTSARHGMRPATHLHPLHVLHVLLAAADLLVDHLLRDPRHALPVVGLGRDEQLPQLLQRARDHSAKNRTQGLREGRKRAFMNRPVFLPRKPVRLICISRPLSSAWSR